MSGESGQLPACGHEHPHQLPGCPGSFRSAGLLPLPGQQLSRVSIGQCKSLDLELSEFSFCPVAFFLETSWFFKLFGLTGIELFHAKSMRAYMGVEKQHFQNCLKLSWATCFVSVGSVTTLPNCS